MKKNRLTPSPTRTPGVQRGERNKLIFMSVLLVLVAAAVITAKLQESKYRAQEAEEVPFPPEVAEAQETIAVPELDVAALEKLVGEATVAQRALLDGPALDMLVEHVRRLRPAHYRALGARDLDAALASEILADPAAHRAEPLHVRGVLDVDSLQKQRRRPDGPEEILGTLTLDDGTRAHVIVLDMPEIVNSSPYLRVDGRFLKVFRRETPAGWVEAPLVVGREATRSYPDLGTVKSIPEDLVLQTQDDTARQITPFPYWLKWNLMAYCRDLQPGDVDWEKAPVLDNQTMLALLKDGAEFRCKPFRIPISRMMDMWVSDVPENPARIQRAAEGWIGNQFWTGGAIKFDAPIAESDLGRGDLVTARGFFLKNLAFEPRDGGIALAPYFVMASVDEHIPAPDHTVEFFLWGMVFLTIGMITLFVVLLMRDKRRSAELQQELVRRRRARRERAEGLGAATPSTES